MPKSQHKNLAESGVFKRAGSELYWAADKAHGAGRGTEGRDRCCGDSTARSPGQRSASRRGEAGARGVRPGLAKYALLGG